MWINMHNSSVSFRNVKNDIRAAILLDEGGNLTCKSIMSVKVIFSKFTAFLLGVNTCRNLISERNCDGLGVAECM